LSSPARLPDYGTPAHQIDTETLIVLHLQLTADAKEQARISPRAAAPFSAAADTAHHFMWAPSIYERPET